MWNVEYKPDNSSQPWDTLDSYDNKTSACISAYRASDDYFMVKVVDTDGSVIWSN